MKYRLGACALVLALAACSRGDGVAESGLDNGNATRQPAGLLMKQAQPMARVSIASAPDRGALISYPDHGKPARREGAHTWYPAKISEAHAFNAIASGEMTLPLPDGNELKLKHERHPEGSDGNWTWIGRVEGGDPGQEAIITFGDKAVYGSIPQADGKPPLEIRTQGGSLWVVQADPSLLKKPNIGDRDMKLPPSRSSRQSAAAQTSTKASAASIPMAAAPAATGSTVDVVIGYTSGFRAARGGQSQAVTRLNYLVEVGNQAYSNSGVNGQLRVVGTLEVNYADNTDNETALEQLTGNTGSGKITVPAALQPIRDAREQYGADIAMFVRKFQTPENDGCGIAWLNGGNGTTIDPTMDDDFGFGVVSDGTDQGTDGKTYFCADETLVHEASHLMGSAHDVGNAGGTQGAFAYSYGYKATASTGNFYTVMAYGDSGQTLYRAFSNPNITFCGGRACGVANQSDNARSLNQTIPLVASFRANAVPFAAELDLYGINKVGAGNKTEVFGMTKASNYGAYSFGSSTGLYAAGTDRSWAFKFGNYNQDGVPDLYAILKAGSSATTDVYVFSGADNFKTMLFGGATVLAKSGADNRWMFKLGDYNKDGVLDIYAIQRMGASGKTEIHVLNGANGFKSYLLNIATVLFATGTDNAWEFELGDYNGDGTMDLYSILKTGGSGKTEVHVLNGADNFQSYLLNTATVLYQTGNINIWNFKVGDFDRDGILDIYAINKTGANNRTELFVMNGANRFQSYLMGGSTAIYATGSDVSWEFELVPARQ